MSRTMTSGLLGSLVTVANQRAGYRFIILFNPQQLQVKPTSVTLTLRPTLQSGSSGLVKIWSRSKSKSAGWVGWSEGGIWVDGNPASLTDRQRHICLHHKQEHLKLIPTSSVRTTTEHLSGNHQAKRCNLIFVCLSPPALLTDSSSSITC